MIVATKLHVPVPPPDRRPRPELLSTLTGATRWKLVLVAAAAGSGKTTLLSHWHAAREEHRPFAWLSLDQADNDPVHFWDCVVASVRTVSPSFGADVLSALRAPGASVTELAVPLIVNHLVELPEPIVLALDDYHEISNPEIHRSLEFLLDHLPPSVQLALATRSDPPLPLARLRARAEMIEVRGRDLSLSDDQAAALLNDSLGLSLDADDIARLQARTEGWAAGLQLLGLSLRGRANRSEHIASLTGDDRHIVDYLGAEVLAGLDEQLRAFLLRTSILERLSGPLCDAVTGSEGSAALLAEIERSNLFLVPLDSTREWFRYHHLFSQLLQHELAATQPGLVQTLHRRAYEWNRAEGFVPEAIHHAIAAGDPAGAAELIAANWLTYVNRGELETVEAWTRALPAGAVEADPRLGLARAWMLLVLGRLEEVEPCVAAAERGVLPGPIQDGSSSVAASAAMVRTSARLMLGDVGRASETAALAIELEPDPDAPWRAIASNAVGMTAYWAGRIDESLEAFSDSVAAAKRVGNHTARIYALGYLAAMRAQAGELAESERIAREALQLADRRELGRHWVTVMVHLARAEAALRRDEPDAAEPALVYGLELAERGGLRLDTAYGLLLLAQVRQRQGGDDEARTLLRRARRRIAACADPGSLADVLAATERLLRAPAAKAARRGDVASALSARELEVLRLLASDMSLREIGAQLYLSLNTIKTHTRNIYFKLGVTSRREAVMRGRELEQFESRVAARRTHPGELRRG